jgi:hypothetical protein
VDVTEGGQTGCELRAFVAIYDRCNRLSNGKVDGGVMGDRNFRYDCGTLKFLDRDASTSLKSVERSEIWRIVSRRARLTNCWRSE